MTLLNLVGGVLLPFIWGHICGKYLFMCEELTEKEESKK